MWKIRLRPLSFFFRKDWYCNRLKVDLDSEIIRNYSVLLDLGAITIIKYKKSCK